MTFALATLNKRDLLLLFFGMALLLLALPGRALAQESRIVSCSSDDMRRNYCEVGPNRGVKLVRQRSDSPCERNRTYGTRGDQIWVDRGCRADFEVISSNGGYRGGNDRGGYGRSNNNNSFTVQCSSGDMKRNYCNIGQNNGVRLVRQLSDSPCQEGRTFGVRGNQLWVDRGCRGSFEVLASRNNRGNQGRDGGGRDNDGYVRNGETFLAMCGSNDMRRNYCEVGPNRGVKLVRQFSQSACQPGRTYGVRGDQIWVDNGCRGQFEVRGR